MAGYTGWGDSLSKFDYDPKDREEASILPELQEIVSEYKWIPTASEMGTKKAWISSCKDFLNWEITKPDGGFGGGQSISIKSGMSHDKQREFIKMFGGL